MKVLVLTGPESSGKSWLGEAVQARFGGLLVGEYVRHFIERQGRDTCYADIPAIARGQLEWEDQARATEPPLLILDTHLLSNMLWSRSLFGDCPNRPCSNGATTCICCSTRKACPGSPTANAANRTWPSGWRSTVPAGTGCTATARLSVIWMATGYSAASERSSMLPSYWLSPTLEYGNDQSYPMVARVERSDTRVSRPGYRCAQPRLRATAQSKA